MIILLAGSAIQPYPKYINKTTVLHFLYVIYITLQFTETINPSVSHFSSVHFRIQFGQQVKTLHVPGLYYQSCISRNGLKCITIFLTN